MPLKKKMASSFRSFVSSAKQLTLGSAGNSAERLSKTTSTSTDKESILSSTASPLVELFPKTDPAVDGKECLRDCDSCSARYPRGFSIDENDQLYGHISGWSAHILVATGKTDWKRDVADEEGSVMEAVEKAVGPKTADGGRLMLSASDMPVPGSYESDYEQPTRVLVLPAFTYVDNVTPQLVPSFLQDIMATAPTTTTPLSFAPSLPTTSPLSQTQCPHSAVILLCSQRTRDARCGQSAPILRRELERHLRPLGLQRDADDERPGGVGVYFISHVGGHKYSANVMIYRRPNAFGLDDDIENIKDITNLGEVGASQCIWLARVKPEDCENLVRYTVLRGKVVKPETQLRGGFDRVKGLLSW